MSEDQPVGDICVLRDPMGPAWTVSICRGMGSPLLLGHFDQRAKAMAFAIEERDRRATAGANMTVHYPDNCPCCRSSQGGKPGGG